MPLGPELLGYLGIAVQARHGCGYRAAVEHHCAGKTFDENQSEAVDIGCRPRRGARRLFRAEIVSGADGGAVLGEAVGVDDASDTEIGELHAVSRARRRLSGDQDVGRFDVAVDHAAVVDVGKGSSNLVSHPGDDIAR